MLSLTNHGVRVPDWTKVFLFLAEHGKSQIMIGNLQLYKFLIFDFSSLLEHLHDHIFTHQLFYPGFLFFLLVFDDGPSGFRIVCHPDILDICKELFEDNFTHLEMPPFQISKLPHFAVEKEFPRRMWHMAVV